MGRASASPRARSAALGREMFSVALHTRGMLVGSLSVAYMHIFLGSF